MSTLIYGPYQARLDYGTADANVFLTHLQVATGRRFAEGRGYFLTFAGSYNDGQDASVSYWVHPSIPLGFEYDTEDDTGEPSKTVEIQDYLVDVLLKAMDRSSGVPWGFRDEEHNIDLPFRVETDWRPGDDAEDTDSTP